MLNYDSPNLPNLSHLSHLLLNSDEIAFTPNDTARFQQLDTAEPFALFRQQLQQPIG